MTATDSKSLATRSSLLKRLKRWDDHESWSEFYGAYKKLMHGFARKHGLTHQEAEDVVQDTLLSVAKALHTFRYDAARSSFRHWLWRLTRNRAVDHVRRRPREIPLDRAQNTECTPMDALERVIDSEGIQPGQEWRSEWESKVLQAALQKLKRQVKSRHYQVFDLVILKDETPARVAEALGISVAQVYLIRHRVMRKFNQMAEAIHGELR